MLAKEAADQRDEMRHLEREIARQKALGFIHNWRKSARESQVLPDGWTRALLRGGRGAGKTWAASRNFAERIVEADPGQWVVIAPTFGDAVHTCLCNPESGLIGALGGTVTGDNELADPGPIIQSWIKTTGRLSLKNGSLIFCDGGDDGAYRVQGKNLRGAWVDEVGLLRQWGTTWDESLRYAVRLDPACIVATGTPKRNMPSRKLVKRLMEDPQVVNRVLWTEDNAENLSRSAMNDFMQIKGTSLERQELYGELLDFSEGALWTMEIIEKSRLESIPRDMLMLRIVVAVDPAGSSDPDRDETGIVVVGLGEDGHGYVMADRSLRGSPATWAAAAVRAYRAFQADRIVGERNFGGDMVKFTIMTVDPDVPYSDVTASRGKMLRAEPAAAAYERGLVHHIGHPLDYAVLEDQMCSFVPGHPRDLGGETIGRRARDHDDRMDALIWALTELGICGEALSLENIYVEPEPSERRVRADDIVGEYEEVNPWLEVYGGTGQGEDGEIRARNPLLRLFGR